MAWPHGHPLRRNRAARPGDGETCRHDTIQRGIPGPSSLFARDQALFLGPSPALEHPEGVRESVQGRRWHDDHLFALALADRRAALTALVVPGRPMRTLAEDDPVDPAGKDDALMLRLIADGLWMSDLFGTHEVSPEQRRALLSLLTPGSILTEAQGFE